MSETNHQIFYRMSTHAEESGLTIFTEKFISIRETAHIHFCVSDHDYKRIFPAPSESMLDAAKRTGHVKIKRIHKVGSRFASTSEEKAFERLKFLKMRQINHLKRDLALTEKFIELTEGKSIDEFEASGSFREIPDTTDLVNRFYRFD